MSIDLLCPKLFVFCYMTFQLWVDVSSLYKDYSQICSNVLHFDYTTFKGSRKVGHNFVNSLRILFEYDLVYINVPRLSLTFYNYANQM